MITDKDTQKLIQRFIEVFATKQELTEAVEGLVTKEDFTEFRDQIFNRIDAVFKELIAMREEQAGHSLRHEDVEDRLNAVEKIPVIALELRKKRNT